ncbi:hypothetical protein AEAC466_18955 [Asticcacaulis sp. AC466]|nr:hypothetical protein AEAC466_18955 [Asticcacaulis sp. AC466]
MAFIALEETPGLSGLNGLNAAALIVLSPVVVGVGFGLTLGIVKLTRWIGGKVRLHSRAGLALLMLTIVGILSPHAYLDGDWLLLGVIEIASLPAALMLATLQMPEREPANSVEEDSGK